MIFRHWPPQYDPANPAALFYWFDFADTSRITKAGGGAIAEGATVGDIANAGTSSAKWVKSGSIVAPTWHADDGQGRAYLRFNGTQALQLDTTAGLTSLDGLTLFAVASVDNPSAGVQSILRIAGGSSRTRAHLYTTTFTGAGGVAAGGRRLDADDYFAVYGSAVAPGQPFILSATFDYAAGRIRAYLDGVLYADSPFQTPGKSQATAPSVILAGVESASPWGNPLTGKIYALGSVRSAPSADDAVPMHHFLRIAKGIG